MSYDVFSAFDALERHANPKEMFQVASEACKKGGLLLLTTATASGFEYQVLGKKAPNLNPINRMNLLSLECIEKQITSAGFEIVFPSRTISTVFPEFSRPLWTRLTFHSGSRKRRSTLINNHST